MARIRLPFPDLGATAARVAGSSRSRRAVRSSYLPCRFCSALAAQTIGPGQQGSGWRALDSTLMMFGHKRGFDTIRVVKEYDTSVPELHCYPGDLNQVWTNIIDNAIQAMGGSGSLTVRTMRENDDMIRGTAQAISRWRPKRDVALSQKFVSEIVVSQRVLFSS
jgi:hypothetical protein